MRPYNDNNVYILGAGFSAEAGLPVMSSFLARMRDAVDWLDNAGRATERDAIEWVLDFRHGSTAAGYRINIDLDNIEHLFSLADAKPEATSSEKIRLAIAATIEFAAQAGRARIGRMRVSESKGWPCDEAWLSTAQRRLDPDPEGFRDVESSVFDHYAAVLSGLNAAKLEPEKNVVITLNYDVVLEDALRRLLVPTSYELSGKVRFDPAAAIDNPCAKPVQIL